LIVENNIESIQDSLDLMNPKDKMKFILDLMKLVLPALRPEDEIQILSEKPSIDYRTLFNFKE
jgi:hypothetical protein